MSEKPFTAADIRFTHSKDGKTVYAIVLETPKDGKVTIKSLAAGSDKLPGKIGSVRLLGGGKLKLTRNASGLHVSMPEKFNGKTAFALKIRSWFPGVRIPNQYRPGLVFEARAIA